MKNRQIQKIKNQLGLTMVELMIALALTTFLMAIVVELVGKSNETYLVNAQLNRMQQVWMTIYATLSRDIHNAGNYGSCVNSAEFIDVAGAPYVYNIARGAIEGFEAYDSTHWSPALPPIGIKLGTEPGDFARGGTDVFTLRFKTNTFRLQQYQGEAIGVAQESNNSQRPIQMQTDLNALGLYTNDYVYLTDNDRCAFFKIFFYSNISGKIYHEFSQLTNDNIGFPVNASLMEVISNTYYIGTDNQGSPALYIKKGSATGEAIASNVEDMQILYGEDTNGDGSANRYLKANDIADMQDVISMKIYFLLRSASEIGTQPRSYTFMGQTYSPADRYLRKEYIMVVALTRGMTYQ